MRKRWQRRRRRAWRSYNRRFRRTYSTSLAHIPDRDEIPLVLNRRGLTGQGAEIGVKLGRFSDLLLRSWQGEKLISIDPWLEAEPDEYVDHANVEQDQHEEFYRRTRELLAKHGSR